MTDRADPLPTTMDQVTGIRGGVVGGAGVRDPVGDRRGSQGHGAEGVGQ
jgi:hypothetical protein